MSDFSLDYGYSNEEALNDYFDVFFHCEDSSIIGGGHMAIIAPLSPFCHRFFRMRKNMKVVDMFFPHIRHSVVKNAVNVIYGKVVSVPKADSKRLSSFLNLLQVKFKSELTVGDKSLGKEFEEDKRAKEACVENQIVAEDEGQNMENEKTGDGEELMPSQSYEASGSSSNVNVTAPEYNLMDHLDDWTVTTTDFCLSAINSRSIGFYV